MAEEHNTGKNKKAEHPVTPLQNSKPENFY